MMVAPTEKAPAEVKVGEGQESAAAEATDLAAMLPPCESRYHGVVGEGHGDGPATHAVLVECPMRCREARWVLLCEQKILTMFAVDAAGGSVRCAGCEHSAALWHFWARVVALSTMEAIAVRDPMQADGRPA